MTRKFKPDDVVTCTEFPNQEGKILPGWRGSSLCRVKWGYLVAWMPADLLRRVDEPNRARGPGLRERRERGESMKRRIALNDHVTHAGVSGKGVVLQLEGDKAKVYWSTHSSSWLPLNELVLIRRRRRRGQMVADEAR